MKILVTGGAGFIGSHIVDALVKEGHSVKVLDNLESQVHQGKKPDYLNPKVEYIFADILNKDILKKSLEGIEIIFHQAAAVGIGQSMYEIAKYTDVNTVGTANLLDFVVNDESIRNSIKKIIIASSMSIYGEGAYNCFHCGLIYPKLREERQLKDKKWEMTCPKCNEEVKAIPTKEEKELSPTSIYALTKKYQEETALLIGKTYNIPTVALRYFNVYGPRQSLANPYTGVVAIFSSMVKNNNPLTIFEDGNQSRDFISVHDIVKANLLVMKSSKADYQMFNVGTGRSTTLLDMGRILTKLYDSELRLNITGKYRLGDIRHCYADISKIREIGFKPEIKLEDGLKELVKWSISANSTDKTNIAINELNKKELLR